MIGPSGGRSARTCQCCEGRDLSQHLGSGCQTDPQAETSKVSQYIQSYGAAIVDPAGLQTKLSGGISWVNVARIGPLLGSCSKLLGGISLPVFPESSYVACICLANLKLIPQAEAPGQLNGPFSLEDWRCMLASHLCDALDMVFFPELSF